MMACSPLVYFLRRITTDKQAPSQGQHPVLTNPVGRSWVVWCGGAGMDIQDMRIFARVSAVQNLSAVGTELGLTPGTISKRIQSLEDELSARLFDRTTRSIRITEEGAAFLAHVERILSEIEAARASVDDKVSKPKGKLKIAAPACLGRRYVGPALCDFLGEYPLIEVQLDLLDRPVSLQE